MNAYIKGGIMAAAVVAGVFFWYYSNQEKLPVNQSPAEYQLLGKMEKEGVPDFALARLDGSPVKLSDFKGKVVILNFWASWCNPCVQEFPSMIKLVEHFKGEVVVLAVSTDDERQDIEAFMKAFGLPKPHFEVVWDEKKTAMKDYGINKIPESFLIRQDMTLIRKVIGIEDWYTEGAIEYFQSLIDTKGGTPAAGAAGGSPAPAAP